MIWLLRTNNGRYANQRTTSAFTKFQHKAIFFMYNVQIKDILSRKNNVVCYITIKQAKKKTVFFYCLTPGGKNNGLIWTATVGTGEHNMAGNWRVFDSFDF